MFRKISQKKTFWRRVCLAVLVLLLSVLQNGRGLFPEIFGARALLLIPAVTAIAMYERNIAGMFYGLFAGMLWDIFAAGNNFNAIFLFALGFGCSTLINTIMRNNSVTHALLSSAAGFVYCLGYWLYHYVVMAQSGAVLSLFRYFIPCVIYTALLSPVIFMIVRAVEMKFKKEELYV